MGNILINRHKPSSMLEAVSSQNHWILWNSPCWACCHSTGKLWNGVKPCSGWFPLQWNYLKKVKSASDVVGICKNGFLKLRCWVPNGLKKFENTLYILVSSCWIHPIFPPAFLSSKIPGCRTQASRPMTFPRSGTKALTTEEGDAVTVKAQKKLGFKRNRPKKL